MNQLNLCYAVPSIFILSMDILSTVYSLSFIRKTDSKISEFDSVAFKTDLKLYWNGLTDFDFNKKLQHLIESIQLLT